MHASCRLSTQCRIDILKAVAADDRQSSVMITAGDFNVNHEARTCLACGVIGWFGGLPGRLVVGLGELLVGGFMRWFICWLADSWARMRLIRQF